jgi:hypothetical protein
MVLSFDSFQEDPQSGTQAITRTLKGWTILSDKTFSFSHSGYPLLVEVVTLEESG